jgi:hypothetical protein
MTNEQMERGRVSLETIGRDSARGFWLIVAAFLLIAATGIYFAYRVQQQATTIHTLTASNCELSAKLAVTNGNSAESFAFDRAERRLLVDLATPSRRGDVRAAIAAIEAVPLTPTPTPSATCVP